MIPRKSRSKKCNSKAQHFSFSLLLLIGLAACSTSPMRTPQTSTPVPTIFQETATLAATETATAVPTVTNEACTTNPAEWTWTTRILGSNLQNLEPPCVYNQLEKTAAWVSATTAYGYTRADAATMLGLFQEDLIAYPENGQISVLSDFKDDLQQVNVTSYVNHSFFAEWRINNAQDPALELSFHGCFDTTNLKQDEVSDGSYPIICQFFGDYRYDYIISKANDQILTGGNNPANKRVPVWFGYANDGMWMWLGNGDEWAVDLSKLSIDHGETTLNLTVMKEKYGLSPQPLPEAWKSAVGQQFQDALLAELNGNK